MPAPRSTWRPRCRSISPVWPRRLPAPSLRLLPQRGLCPCCGSTPVSGVITATGQTPGARYLHCSLCSTAWNHVRAVCINCGESRSLALQGIEGDSGAVKAETCNECHTYAKMLYQARDMKVDPFADDLATLGLDLLVAEAGWSRHAPNPLLLIGPSGLAEVHRAEADFPIRQRLRRSAFDVRYRNLPRSLRSPSHGGP